MRHLTLCLGLACVLATSAWSQLDRGALTGTVMDRTSAVVPGARVSAKNIATNVSFRTVATATGQYTVPTLPFGTYEVIFEANGFTRLVRTGVEIGAAQTVRLDALLELGMVSETVSVTAEVGRLQTETPETGTSLTSKQMIDLPLAIDGARRAEDFVYKLTPGVSGGSNAGYFVGSTAYSKEALLDGATVAANRAGHFGESSISVEAIQAFKVQTSGLSAEYGRTQSGVLNFVMKSGTNEIHGSGFGMVRNEVLNANTFANNARGERRAPDRKHAYAGSFGGPVFLPKLYNGRNRSFFYATYERYSELQLPFGTPNRTVPLPEFYEGDLSRLLGPATTFTDGLNRPVPRGAVYDPATFRQLPGGRWIGDMFPGNRIPVSRFSEVSKRLNEIAKKHYLPTVRDASGQFPLVNNALYPQAQNPEVDQYQFSVKGDQNINDAHKLSGSYSFVLRERLNTVPSSQIGMWDRNDPLGGPLNVTLRQSIPTHYVRLSHNWTASPTVVNQFIVYLNRFGNKNTNLQSGIDGSELLGIRGLPSRGFPDINWGGGPFVTFAQAGNSDYSYSVNTMAGVSNTLSLSKGRHFLKAGFDYRRNNHVNVLYANPGITFHARQTAIPNEVFSANFTGHSFASYLLGMVNNASLPDPGGFAYRVTYPSLFVQDDFKVHRSLTLQLGLRWEYTSPLQEAHKRMASWNPNLRDPESGLPGAFEFAGSCKACTGRSYFGKRDWNNLGPRFGFAWQPAANWTVRGGYGVVYETIGEHGGPGGWSQSAWRGRFLLDADPVEPWRGVFNWDRPVSAAERYQAPAFDVSQGNRTQPGMFSPEYYKVGYSQRWNFNLQREIGKSLVVDIGYLGGKGTALRGGELADFNQLDPKYLQQFGRSLNNPVRNAQDAAANRIAYPYPGFAGTVASALRPYPQVFGNNLVSVYSAPLGFSTYHALQLIVDKRMSRGLNIYASYNWAKSLTNVSSSIESQEVNKPLDYYNLKLEKAVSEFDIPHMGKAFVAYELPFGKGRTWSPGNSVLRSVASGWTVSVIANYQSGTPLLFTGSTPLSGGWNGTARRVNIAPGPLMSSGFDQSRFELSSPSSGVNTVLNKSIYSDIAPLTLGTAAPRYTQAREFPLFNEDIGIQRVQTIGDKYRFQIRAEMLNIFNRHRLTGIETNITNPLFGQVTGASGYRVIQLGARVDF